MQFITETTGAPVAGGVMHSAGYENNLTGFLSVSRDPGLVTHRRVPNGTPATEVEEKKEKKTSDIPVDKTLVPDCWALLAAERFQF